MPNLSDFCYFFVVNEVFEIESKTYFLFNEKKNSIIQSRQRGQVVKSAGIPIDMVLVQNLLAPFCCVLEKDTSQHFCLLSGLGKQF